MLNKHQHGELYFGVKPDGTPIGQNVSEETLRNVSHRIAESIKPRIYPIVKKVVLDGKDCIYVKVEGNQIPYFAFGVAKMRVADEDITMSPEQITTVLNQLELTCDDKLLNAGKALLNSFCHKDYASGESNEVAIYKDRVEIYNPGAFPEGYDPQFFIEQPSRPIRRNPMIARTLYYSKDIESFGTGLKRIAEVCEEAGVRYEFQKLKNGFVVCFYRSSYRPKGSTGKV